jgi:hypothetical protein
MFCLNESDETLLANIKDSKKSILERFFWSMPTECFTNGLYMFIYRLNQGFLQ